MSKFDRLALVVGALLIVLVAMALEAFGQEAPLWPDEPRWQDEYRQPEPAGDWGPQSPNGGLDQHAPQAEKLQPVEVEIDFSKLPLGKLARSSHRGWNFGRFCRNLEEWTWSNLWWICPTLLILTAGNSLGIFCLLIRRR